MNSSLRFLAVAVVYAIFGSIALEVTGFETTVLVFLVLILAHVITNE